ncbi:glycosyl hydrolase family 18 protein [Paenibacillus hexagrammi]|uniref:chitinase n=1 Tax=Paenibacillus hexagrammi TaxID=2908839 RepID=A0ABY3SGF7_9BACL|nr:glycosyl hydrolase family 18 protein [Paenibacillus sp. YPD9-1]UJF33011.1 glycosyl hydrolase family 18 protein [Paenibacillus sp. YPD9-1]
MRLQSLFRRFFSIAAIIVLIGTLFTPAAYAAKDKKAPTAPTGLKVTRVTDSSVTLAWNASTDNVKVASYRVYQGTSLKATTASLTYGVTGLSSGSTYTFYVKAVDSAGNISASSNQVTATTLKAASTSPSPTPSPTASPAPSTSPSPTPSPTASPAPSTSPSPTPSPTASPAPSTSPSPTPSPTASPAPSPSPSPTPAISTAKALIGYYSSWSTYSGKQIADLDGSKLTHINYAFANIGSDLRIALGDPYADVEQRFPDDTGTEPFFGNFNQLLKLKQKYPGLKTLISVGGWSWSSKFSDVALTDASRTVFADSVVTFITKYGFDGVDIDWEYPVEGGEEGNVHRAEDKTNFTLLMQKLREKLDAQKLVTGKTYLLTFAGAADAGYVNHIELGKLQLSTDYINLMSYDFHGTWDAKTGLNAPLYKDPASGSSYETSVKDAVQLYLNAGVPAGKLVMGVPFYGYKYDNVTNASNGLYQSFSGGASVTYAEIVSKYLNQGYTRYFNSASQVPYLFNGTSFISYDDPQSIGLKAGYVKSSGLGGAMIWTVSQDTLNRDLLDALYQGMR